MTELKRALELAVKQLTSYSESARVDAEVLLAHIINQPRTYLYTYPEACLTEEQFFRFQKLIARRSLGTPVAYLTGTREFWSLPLKVNEKTLIPRPETELIVELTLSLLLHQWHAHILDLGTGSGAIALALGKERKDWQIMACDCSKDALKTAQENAQHTGISNVQFFQSDWFSKIELPQRFHAIVSNPPYIAANDPHLHQGDVRFEPALALISDNNGYSALQHIIEHSLARLEPNGLLLIEHGYDQKKSVMSLLRDHGYVDVQCWQDWQGNDRVSGGRRKIS